MYFVIVRFWGLVQVLPESFHCLIGLPRLTEISVTRGSELTVRSRFVFSRFRFGSGLHFFLTINVVKTDILTGKSYKI